MKAYQAYVTATRGTVLLGGTKHHESHPFATVDDANKWLHTVVKTNCKAGKTPSAWGWKEVEHPNPIR